MIVCAVATESPTPNFMKIKERQNPFRFCCLQFFIDFMIFITCFIIWLRSRHQQKHKHANKHIANKPSGKVHWHIWRFNSRSLMHKGKHDFRHVWMHWCYVPNSSFVLRLSRARVFLLSTSGAHGQYFMTILHFFISLCLCFLLFYCVISLFLDSFIIDSIMYVFIFLCI